ncbi:hypothetical protein BO78DRAFT_7551 [Aspergillus sclerotiicarbonarius CBS 121057]|uniref:Uncharacterized protein n=1 Tax=Aspergillus sclerotiicarbonarius (strain CBS 121057 / IBT 28362) TaxID=1448318 RepID=A0A319EQU6_ASPSB|nr:hypothetical protein BO78DRAFT_7551 [Aspergillus sclerotiicarbonarius CBS 121057]
MFPPVLVICPNRSCPSGAGSSSILYIAMELLSTLIAVIYTYTFRSLHITSP